MVWIKMRISNVSIVIRVCGAVTAALVSYDACDARSCTICECIEIDRFVVIQWICFVVTDIKSRLKTYVSVSVRRLQHNYM